MQSFQRVTQAIVFVENWNGDVDAHLSKGESERLSNGPDINKLKTYRFSNLSTRKTNKEGDCAAALRFFLIPFRRHMTAERSKARVSAKNSECRDRKCHKETMGKGFWL